jgi:hypothetical protein
MWKILSVYFSSQTKGTISTYFPENSPQVSGHELTVVRSSHRALSLPFAQWALERLALCNGMFCSVLASMGERHMPHRTVIHCQMSPKWGRKGVGTTGLKSSQNPKCGLRASSLATASDYFSEFPRLKTCSSNLLPR